MRHAELPSELRHLIDGRIFYDSDGSICVEGNVMWTSKNLTVIPIKFRRVTGNVWLHCNQLTSLENAPDFIGGDLGCYGNKLTSLNGLGEVRGKIYLGDNPKSPDSLTGEHLRKRAKKDLLDEEPDRDGKSWCQV